MNRKIVSAIVLSAFTAILLTGCGSAPSSEQKNNHPISASSGADTRSPSQEKTSLVYYKASDDGMHIEPITLSIAASDRTPLEAVKIMIRGDRKQKYPLLPAGLSVKNVSIKDGTATVNFSKELNSLQGGTSQTLFIKMTTDTLTEFSDVKRVVIRCEGKTPRFQIDMTKSFKRDTSIVKK